MERLLFLQTDGQRDGLSLSVGGDQSRRWVSLVAIFRAMTQGRFTWMGPSTLPSVLIPRTVICTRLFLFFTTFYERCLAFFKSIFKPVSCSCTDLDDLIYYSKLFSLVTSCSHVPHPLLINTFFFSVKLFKKTLRILTEMRHMVKIFSCWSHSSITWIMTWGDLVRFVRSNTWIAPWASIRRTSDMTTSKE